MTTSNRELTDEQLMVEVQHGRQWALHSLYDRFVNRVYGMALQKLGDPAEAQDITHDVFLTRIIDVFPASLVEHLSMSCTFSGPHRSLAVALKKASGNCSVMAGNWSHRSNLGGGIRQPKFKLERIGLATLSNFAALGPERHQDC